MHSSFNSSHKAWQTDGMILLKVGFGILKMSSSTENDAGPLKYRRVAWRRSRAGTAERISVSCFEIRGETLKYVNYLISLSPSIRLYVKKCMLPIDELSLRHVFQLCILLEIFFHCSVQKHHGSLSLDCAKNYLLFYDHTIRASIGERFGLELAIEVSDVNDTANSL